VFAIHLFAALIASRVSRSLILCLVRRMDSASSNRPLSDEERHLIRWMLEHGEPDARDYLAQLERAEVEPWRCACGCASLSLSIPGLPEPTGGLRPLGQFVFGSEADLSGIFVYEQSNILSGVEVYGLASDAPSWLPSPESLRPFPNPEQNV